MLDRVPKYPGRVRLTPVPGQENTFDMTRADEATQDGTPLNTATLLKQQTAALFGLGADAVPDDVFFMLSRFHVGLGNEYLWAKTGNYLEKVESPSTGNSMGIVLFNDKDSNVVLPARVYYGDAVLMDDRGDLYIPGYQVLTITEEWDCTNLNTLIGKCFYNVDAPKDKRGYYKCTSGTPVFIDGQLRFGDFDGYEYSVVEKAGLVGYVNSPDPNAYPPAVDDGFTYTPLGRLGGFAKIETGSYVGTGKYGTSTTNSLTFSFKPKFVWIYRMTSVNGTAAYDVGTSGTAEAKGFLTDALTTSFARYDMESGSTSTMAKISGDGKTITWYNTASHNHQFNASNRSYHYMAFG